MQEIFTYGNGVMIGELMQAVAALVATDDYLKLIRLVFVITTAVVAIQIVWSGRFTATGRLFAIILMMNAAILTTTDVQITDRVNSANDSVVADVPAGLAGPLAIFTSIGDWATQSFETVFSMPNDLRYTSNGLLFASRLVNASTEYVVTDAVMANNLAEFAQACIFYGAMAGWFNLRDIMEAPNIWASLPAASFGNAIFAHYTDPATGVSNMNGCRDIRNLLEADWAAAIDKMASDYGRRQYPQHDEATAKALLLSALPATYTYMTGIAQSAATLIQQNAMQNTLRRSATAVASEAGATGAIQDFALSQAEAAQRTTYSTLGALAGRMMSLFHNVLETLIYGIFPIAFVFMLISLMQGKAILMYFKLLFWLQLWPPMFAILNYAMSVYGAEATASQALISGGAVPVLSMMTVGGIRQVNADMAAMAGYLSWMIPMFSWAIASGTGFAATQLAGAIGGVAQSTGSAAASAAATGNLSLGNVSMRNTSAGNYSAHNSGMFTNSANPTLNTGVGSRTDPVTGATYRETAGGFGTLDMPMNKAPFTASLGTALRSSVNTSTGEAVEAVKSSGAAFMSTTQGLYSNMQNLARTGQSGTTITNGSDVGSRSDFSRSFGEMDSVAAKFAKEHGMSKDQAAAMLLAASMDTGKSGMGMIAGLALGISGKGEVSYRGQSRSSEAWKDAQETAKKNDFGQKWNNAVKAGQQEAEQRSNGSTDTGGRAFQAGFNRQRQASSNLQASMTEAQSWQRLQSRLNESGASGNVDAVAGLMAYGRAQGIDMARLAAQATNIAGGGQSATNAAKQLDGLVNDYVASLASGKVAEAPTQAGVQSAHAANLNEVEAKGSNVIPQSVQDQRDLAGTGAAWGIPSSEAVATRSAELQARSGALEAGYADVVETGGSSVQARGQPIQEEAARNSAPGNQHHVANATVQVGEAMVDTVRDIKESASYLAGQILGGGAGSAPSSSAQNSQNQPEPWAGYHQDLPPLPEDGTSTNHSQRDRPVAGGRETWANELPD
jgi:conjugal transfer mating pair stabilization protein TraG